MSIIKIKFLKIKTAPSGFYDIFPVILYKDVEFLPGVKLTGVSCLSNTLFLHPNHVSLSICIKKNLKVACKDFRKEVRLNVAIRK